MDQNRIHWPPTNRPTVEIEAVKNAAEASPSLVVPPSMGSAPVDIHFQPPAPVIRPAQRLSPYVEFTGRLRPIADMSREQIIKGLRSIVAVEGPMTGHRLHVAFVKASGGQVVGKAIASMLNSAIRVAVRHRILVEDAPLGEHGIQPRTYRLAEQPQARARTLGPRTLEDIPPRDASGQPFLHGGGQARPRRRTSCPPVRGHVVTVGR